MSTERTEAPDCVNAARNRAATLDPLENTIGGMRTFEGANTHDSSEPWEGPAIGAASMIETGDVVGMTRRNENPD